MICLIHHGGSSALPPYLLLSTCCTPSCHADLPRPRPITALHSQAGSAVGADRWCRCGRRRRGPAGGEHGIVKVSESLLQSGPGIRGGLLLLSEPGPAASLLWVLLAACEAASLPPSLPRLSPPRSPSPFTHLEDC